MPFSMQLKMAAGQTNKLNHVTNDSSMLLEFNSTRLNKTSEKITHHYKIEIFRLDRN